MEKFIFFISDSKVPKFYKVRMYNNLAQFKISVNNFFVLKMAAIWWIVNLVCKVIWRNEFSVKTEIRQARNLVKMEIQQTGNFADCEFDGSWLTDFHSTYY